jgi:hypothetical protein
VIIKNNWTTGRVTDMSVNWNIQTLMSVLKTQTVWLTDVEVGDIVVGDDGPEHVGFIDTSKPNRIGLIDLDDNGIYYKIRYPGSKAPTMMEIICRDAIDSDGLAGLVQHRAPVIKRMQLRMDEATDPDIKKAFAIAIKALENE